MSDILIVRNPLASEDLRRLVLDGFGDMVKYVGDLERELLALGGQLHADAEAVLLEDGSRREHLWGANYFPGKSTEECIEFTSLINIRPAQSNPRMEIADPRLQEIMRALTFRLIGRGEALA